MVHVVVKDTYTKVILGTSAMAIRYPEGVRLSQSAEQGHSLRVSTNTCFRLESRRSAEIDEAIS